MANCSQLCSDAHPNNTFRRLGNAPPFVWAVMKYARSEVCYLICVQLHWGGGRIYKINSLEILLVQCQWFCFCLCVCHKELQNAI